MDYTPPAAEPSLTNLRRKKIKGNKQATHWAHVWPQNSSPFLSLAYWDSQLLLRDLCSIFLSAFFYWQHVHFFSALLFSTLLPLPSSSTMSSSPTDFFLYVLSTVTIHAKKKVELFHSLPFALPSQHEQPQLTIPAIIGMEIEARVFHNAKIRVKGRTSSISKGIQQKELT